MKPLCAALMFLVMPIPSLAQMAAAAEATPLAARPYDSPAMVRQAVRTALRENATANSPQARHTTTLQLVEVLLVLKQDRLLTRQERISLHAHVRSRLMAIQRRLQAQISRAPAEQPKAILGQVVPASGFGNRSPTATSADHGPELVGLIQRVISPATWDTNGGPGAVVYYRNLHALVVRAPAEVHGQIGGLVRQMRK